MPATEIITAQDNTLTAIEVMLMDTEEITIMVIIVATTTDTDRLRLRPITIITTMIVATDQVITVEETTKEDNFQPITAMEVEVTAEADTVGAVDNLNNAEVVAEEMAMAVVTDTTDKRKSGSIKIG